MRRLPPLVALLAAASTIAASAASNTGSGTSVAVQTVSIDGVACLEVTAWSVGATIAPVVVEAASGTAPAKKHLGAPRYQPIVVQASLPLTKALSDCVADLLAGTMTRRTLQLTNYDGSARTVGSPLNATNAIAVELQMPALDATSSSPLSVTIIFQADSVQAATIASSSGAASASRPTVATASAFAVQLSGLSGTAVARVEAFVVRRDMGAGAPGRPEIPNLVLSFGGAAPADWTAWYDDFVVTGNCDDTKEKSGAINLLSADLKSVLMAVQLDHVGIVRLANPPAAGGSIARAAGELYCETMTLVAGGTNTASSTDNSSGNGSGSGSGSSSSPIVTGTDTTKAINGTLAPTLAGVPATQTGMITPAPAEPIVSPPTATAPRVVTTPAPTAAVTSTAAPAPVTSPDDKGARDPADFPRPAGTVRVSYQGIRQKGWVQENAGYTAEKDSDAIISFYEKALTAAGWEETGRNENNYAVDGAHQIVSYWENANRTVGLTIVDVAPGQVQIQIRLEVTMKL